MLSRRDQELLVDVVRQAAIAVRSSLLARELQESREQLVLAREEDRRRIRRDLHDGLGPVLGGVAMRLDAAGNAVGADPGPPTARRESRAEIIEALADVRRLVHGLRPPPSTTWTAGRGRAAGRPHPRGRARCRGGRTTWRAARGGGGRGNRIVSEALANVARHARRAVVHGDARDRTGGPARWR